jgi:hypothetical protein
LVFFCHVKPSRFQSTGRHFLDFNNIHVEANERLEDLYQRLARFIEDNLLRASGNIQHHGEAPKADEELSPSLENMVVLTWLRLIHNELPHLVVCTPGSTTCILLGSVKWLVLERCT